MKAWRVFCYFVCLIMLGTGIVFVQSGFWWQSAAMLGCAGVWVWNAHRGYGA